MKQKGWGVISDVNGIEMFPSYEDALEEYNALSDATYIDVQEGYAEPYTEESKVRLVEINLKRIIQPVHVESPDYDWEWKETIVDDEH